MSRRLIIALSLCSTILGTGYGTRAIAELTYA
jgi:hypothetical protein